MCVSPLSWLLKSPRRSQKQTAYQVLVASSPATLEHNQGDVWDIAIAAMLFLEYPPI
jgi:hypothetical protein